MYLGIMVFGTLLSEVQNACEDLYHLTRNRSRLVLEVAPPGLYVEGLGVCL